MTTDSVIEVAKYQRSVGAVPKAGAFSIRTNWGRQTSALSGSLRKYIASYKAVSTHLALVGVKGKTGLKTGVVVHLLNGSPNSSGSSQSDFWTEIINGMQAAYQAAASNGNIKLVLDWFSLTSSSGDVSSPQAAFSEAVTLLSNLTTKNSATASGQFEIDVQNTIFFNPGGVADPKPVFNWTLTISLDDSANSITLTITTSYDHMDSNALATIAGIIAGVMTAGLLGAGGGVASGIAVGNAVSQAYDAAANNKMLDFLAHDLSVQPWTAAGGPIMFKASHPTSAQFALSMTVLLDSTTFNGIEGFFQNEGAAVLGLAELLSLLPTAF